MLIYSIFIILTLSFFIKLVFSTFAQRSKGVEFFILFFVIYFTVIGGWLWNVWGVIQALIIFLCMLVMNNMLTLAVKPGAVK